MREPSYTLSFRTPLAPGEALRRLADVAAHSDIVPLTTGRGPNPDELAVDDVVVARTALGPFGFDDVMRVRQLERPQLLVLDKVGSLLGGDVRIEVTDEPGGSGGSRVQWEQRVDLPGVRRALPKPVAAAVVRVTSAVMRRGYARYVPRILEA